MPTSDPVAASPERVCQLLNGVKIPQVIVKTANGAPFQLLATIQTKPAVLVPCSFFIEVVGDRTVTGSWFNCVIPNHNSAVWDFKSLLFRRTGPPKSVRPLKNTKSLSLFFPTVK